MAQCDANLLRALVFAACGSVALLTMLGSKTAVPSVAAHLTMFDAWPVEQLIEEHQKAWMKLLHS